VDALERITNLVALLLETRRPLTTEQIRDQLAGMYPANPAAFRGAFERDKAVMREVGIPYEMEVLSGDQAGRTAYWIERSKYELADLDLRPDERQALQLAMATTRLSEGSVGVLKLGGDAPNAAPQAAALINVYVPELDELPALHGAVASHCEVTFAYRGIQRRLQPYGLLLRSGRWYVVGHDLDQHEQRTYRVDRIEGPVAIGTPDSFVAPSNFDAATAFPADARQLGATDDTADRAVVRIYSRRATLLGETAEHADGSVTVEVPCANRDAFRAWLFSWGDEAEVVGPAEVRQQTVAWLRSVAARRSQ